MAELTPATGTQGARRAMHMFADEKNSSGGTAIVGHVRSAPASLRETLSQNGAILPHYSSMAPQSGASCRILPTWRAVEVL